MQNPSGTAETNSVWQWDDSEMDIAPKGMADLTRSYGLSAEVTYAIQNVTLGP